MKVYSRKKLKQIISLIKDSGAIEKSVEVSDRYLAKAFKELEGLPDIRAKKNLNEIAKYIGKRKF